MTQLNQVLTQFTSRYQRALAARAGLLLLLGWALAGTLAWRLHALGRDPFWAVGLPLVVAVGVAAAVSWWLRRRWISRRAAARHLDRVLGLQQRLITAEEFARTPEASPLYPLLLADAARQAGADQPRLPRPFDRSTGALLAALLILLVWPRVNRVLPPPIGGRPAPQQDEPAARREEPSAQSPSSQQQPSQQQPSGGAGQDQRQPPPAAQPSGGQGEPQPGAGGSDGGQQPSGGGDQSADRRQRQAGEGGRQGAGQGEGEQQPSRQDRGEAGESPSAAGRRDEPRPSGATDEGQPRPGTDGAQPGGQEADAAAQQQKESQKDSRGSAQREASRTGQQSQQQGQQQSGQGGQAGGAQQQASQRPGASQDGGSRSSEQKGKGERAQGTATAGQGGGGQLLGEGEALKAEIRELLKEVSGEIKQLQAQMSSADQQPQAGTGTDPSLYGAPEALDRSAGTSLTVELRPDEAPTSAQRPGGGTGEAGRDVSQASPTTQAESATLSEEALQEPAAPRQPVPAEYRSIFDRLRRRPSSPEGDNAS